MVSRRRFLELGALGLGAAATRCDSLSTLAQLGGDGRLTARPGVPTGTPTLGRQALGLGGAKDGLLYVPVNYRPDTAAPLVLMLHGAGGSASGGIRPFEALADSRGFILLAPDSRDFTWDVILGGFGPDVAFIDSALEAVFRSCRVDPARIAIEGFSDGASYALSLGLTNGDLFSHVVAFSPGFRADPTRTGRPRVFVSHGTADQILPIQNTSRRIVPDLQGLGYSVVYREFQAGHLVPSDIAVAAADWMAAA